MPLRIEEPLLPANPAAKPGPRADGPELGPLGRRLPRRGGRNRDRGRALLTAPVGLWLRSGAMAPAVAGRGGSVGLSGGGGGGGGRGPRGAGTELRLQARWRRKQCSSARGRAARLLPDSRSSSEGRRPGSGVVGELGRELGREPPGRLSSSLADEGSSSSPPLPASCSPPGGSWSPGSAGAGARPLSGLSSKSQAGGADAVP